MGQKGFLYGGIYWMEGYALHFTSPTSSLSNNPSPSPALSPYPPKPPSNKFFTFDRLSPSYRYHLPRGYLYLIIHPYIHISHPLHTSQPRIYPPTSPYSQLTAKLQYTLFTSDFRVQLPNHTILKRGLQRVSFPWQLQLCFSLSFVKT